MYGDKMNRKLLNRKLLKEKRLSKNLTQKELAKQLNISERHYRYIEAGTRNPSLSLVLKLSEVLEIGLSDLFSTKS